MEAKYVTSPGGSRFPRTPANAAAFEKGKGSNEKPEKKKDALKVEVEDKIGVEELKMKLKAKVDAKDEMRAEIELYRGKMKEMQVHLEMMEGLVEDNERKFVTMLEAEREHRHQVEAQLDALDNGRVHSADALKVRELELREKEFDLAEKKYVAHKAADDDDGGPGPPRLRRSNKNSTSSVGGFVILGVVYLDPFSRLPHTRPPRKKPVLMVHGKPYTTSWSWDEMWTWKHVTHF